MTEQCEHLPVARLLARIEEAINGCGWAVVGTVTEDGSPYSYTVGLWRTFRHPEVLVVGLDGPIAQGVLNNVGERVRKGRRFGLGDVDGGIVEGYDVKFLVIYDEEYFSLGGAERLEPGFSAMQLVYPDASGAFSPGYVDWQLGRGRA